MRNWLRLLKYQIISDLRMKFLGSRLGLAWTFLNPLLQVGMYIFLFSFVFKIRLGTGGTEADYLLFLFSTMGAWLTFQDTVISSASTMIRNSSIIKNVVFPLEIFPISTVFSSLTTMGTCLIVYYFIYFVSGKSLFAVQLWLPILILIQIVVSLSIAFFVSTLGAFVRDIVTVLPILMQLLLIATPIFYEETAIPATVRFVCYLNPFYYLFDSYRKVLFYGQEPHILGLLILCLSSLILLYVSFSFYKKFKGYFEAVV